MGDEKCVPVRYRPALNCGQCSTHEELKAYLFRRWPMKGPSWDDDTRDTFACLALATSLPSNPKDDAILEDILRESERNYDSSEPL